jgi:disulfide bond formation protein DsbB
MKLPDFIRQNPIRGAVALSAAASAFFLALALISQYGFKLYPCELCIYQRIPYAVILFISLLALWRVSHPKTMKNVAMFCILLFVVDAGIAIYHSGIEWGIFPNLLGCSNVSSAGQTIEEMRAAILNAPLVSCDQAQVYVLGLSMAAWNALAALIMTVVTFRLVLLSRKLS